VLILHPERLEATPAADRETKRAEACVPVVALTRAKRELVFVAQPEGGGSDEQGGGVMERLGRVRQRLRALLPERQHD
jgi:hypothetical protein